MTSLAENSKLTQLGDGTESARYDADFVLWAERQAQLLRDGLVEELDRDNLIEEIEAMARRAKKELHNRLEVLLIHLLKCKFQPERKGESWIRTINNQRREIRTLIDISPSLKHDLLAQIDEAYPPAVKSAAQETQLKRRIFPSVNPFSPDDIFDSDFIP